MGAKLVERTVQWVGTQAALALAAVVAVVAVVVLGVVIIYTVALISIHVFKFLWMLELIESGVSAEMVGVTLRCVNDVQAAA